MSKLILSAPSGVKRSDVLLLSRESLRHWTLRIEAASAHDWRAQYCRKCGLHDESAEHIVLFDCKGLKQERADDFGKFVNGRRMPEERLVRDIQRFLDLSSLLK